jgi:hypothetical protein
MRCILAITVSVLRQLAHMAKKRTIDSQGPGSMHWLGEHRWKPTNLRLDQRSRSDRAHDRPAVANMSSGRPCHRTVRPVLCGSLCV